MRVTVHRVTTLLEPGRGQLGVAHCVLDVLLPEVRLDGARVVSLRRQRKTAGMPQVRLRSRAFEHAGKPSGRKRRAALRLKYERRLGLLPTLSATYGDVAPDFAGTE